MCRLAGKALTGLWLRRGDAAALVDQVFSWNKMRNRPRMVCQGGLDTGGGRHADRAHP